MSDVKKMPILSCCYRIFNYNTLGTISNNAIVDLYSDLYIHLENRYK